ncbi:protein SGT1 homolog isoform X2 [Rhinoderma darwinii]|uniref:protein SGT1 homolog isoform X2 n=1 Tax=Rhinoderma darwinii TaxID=43563 RepID=UPI003F6669B3
MTEATGPQSAQFSDSYITENPQRSLEEVTKALEEKPEDAEYYSQRAYAHMLLQHYNDAVLDAERSLELQPNNANAFLRKGEAEFHLKNYPAAQDTFKQGLAMNSSVSSFSSWIKICEEKLNSSSCPELPTNQETTSKYRHDWYQTESQVIITVMIKNVQKEDVHIKFAERQLTLNVNLPSGENYNLTLVLFHSIAPEQCTYKILSTKIEIKMRKTEALRWDKLEGHSEHPVKHFTPESMHKYPSSSHYTKNWDKLVVDIKEEEKNEKLEGDAALNHLFQQIYTDGNDEVKRAMNKSFMESGGTVLSTNWSDVGKRKVDVNPPDDMEYKKF